MKKICICAILFFSCAFGESIGQKYYNLLQEAIVQKNWKMASHYCKKVRIFAHGTPFSKDIDYYDGLVCFNLEKYEAANELFSAYLKNYQTSHFFEDVMNYKFLIAESYKNGLKKPLFGWDKLPKIEDSSDDAIKIYDEILSVFASNEIAAKSLFAKGALLLKQEQYKESIEIFETCIKRYPRDDVAIESFLNIGIAYFKQCSKRNPNYDLINLSEINIAKFESAFPGEERIKNVISLLDRMKEIYANSLYEIGQFFERTNKPDAAKIYYLKITAQFPNTESAKRSNQRLSDERLQKI